MRVEVVYCDSKLLFRRGLEVAEGAHIHDALEASALLKRFPEIDLSRNVVGVFGQVKKLDAPLREGDRVEVYREIVCDPETVPRRDREEEDDDD